MQCPNCNSSEFHYSDWQDERDDVNRICDICNSRYSPLKETESDDSFDKTNWIESKIHITFRHDPNEIDAGRLAHNVLRHCIESDGFGEIIEIETE